MRPCSSLVVYNECLHVYLVVYSSATSCQLSLIVSEQFVVMHVESADKCLICRVRGL